MSILRWYILAGVYQKPKTMIIFQKNWSEHFCSFFWRIQITNFFQYTQLFYHFFLTLIIEKLEILLEQIIWKKIKNLQSWKINISRNIVQFFNN